MDTIDAIAELDKFSRRRTAYSGGALALYLAAVSISQSLLVAVAGGFALVVVRSWAIDRLLFGNGLEDASMQRAILLTAREDAKRTHELLGRIYRAQTRAASRKPRDRDR